VDANDLTEELVKSRFGQDEFDKYAKAKTPDALELDSGRIVDVYKCLASAISALRLAMRRIPPEYEGGPLPLETLFEDLTVDLSMEGGDANTTAAAACAVLGAYLGYTRLTSY
jgi:hypothetical protein